jgi:hypothetical protein
VSGAPLDEKLGSRSYGPAAGVALALIFVAPFFDLRRPFRLLPATWLAIMKELRNGWPSIVPRTVTRPRVASHSPCIGSF